MARLIYGRLYSHPRYRYEVRTFKTFHAHLRRLLEELAQGPRMIGRNSVLCRHCGRFIQGSLPSESLCEECSFLADPGKSRCSTVPCNRCGIRFSSNLIDRGLCHNCRATREGATKHEDQTDFNPRSSTSDSTLKAAYRVLECNENASDEVIRGQYRRLAKECHTDCLPLGLARERIREANERFHQLHEAYERIMNSRKQSQ